MKNRKKALLIGVTILALGVILAVPALADLDNEQPHVSQLYYIDEETGEYLPWYDPENPDSYTPPEGCLWWDSDNDDELDWVPHWGKRQSSQEDDSYGYGRGRRGRCGGYGSQSNNRHQTNQN